MISKLFLISQGEGNWCFEFPSLYLKAFALLLLLDLSYHLSVCQSAYGFSTGCQFLVCLSVCLSVSFFLFDYLSVCLSICPSDCLSVCLTIRLCFFPHLSPGFKSHVTELFFPFPQRSFTEIQGILYTSGGRKGIKKRLNTINDGIITHEAWFFCNVGPPSMNIDFPLVLFPCYVKLTYYSFSFPFYYFFFRFCFYLSLAFLIPIVQYSSEIHVCSSCNT